MNKKVSDLAKTREERREKSAEDFKKGGKYHKAMRARRFPLW